MTSARLHPADAACAVLRATAPAAKIAAAEEALQGLETAAPPPPATASPLPERPARPARPTLAAPGDVPRRKLGSKEGRIALLHAVAHIEFNAIDLAFDMAARFHEAIAALDLDSKTFLADWVRIGAEEARHFSLINARLGDYGAAYGDLPAHDGLWEAAATTAHDVAARLAIAPLVLEARGLDVTPGMISRLSAVADKKSASILQIIYTDEIGHVACGRRWFEAVCQAQGDEPQRAFKALRGQYFAGNLKPPFNHEARQAAGLDRTFYDEDAAKDPI